MDFRIKLAEDFDFEKILKYKPFFFFYRNEPQAFLKIENETVRLDFSQKGAALNVSADRQLNEKTVTELKERLSFCFGAQENLSDLYTLCKSDKVLKRFYDSIHGNRLISAFTDFEALVSIICSQNVTFHQYKKMVLNIIDRIGDGKYFPTAYEILVSKDKLKECGVGYRESFILDLAHYMRYRNSIELNRLSLIKGIGPYSLDIYRLFQLRDYRAFYVDILIKRIIKEKYGSDLKTDKAVRDFAKTKWGNYQGIAEVYLQKFLNDN